MSKDSSPVRRVKVIPCLDTANGRLVKGVKFANMRDLGDPVEAAKRYCEQGADELWLLDILASKENRVADTELIRKVAAVCTVPLCIGGGISSLDDADKVFAAGAAKVGIGSGAQKNPEVIRRISYKYGAQATTALVDARRKDGKYIVLGVGQTDTDLELGDWIVQLKELGAGEILLTTMQDGTRAGFDLEATALAAQGGLPVVASGGAGTLEHFYEAATTGNASGVLAASLFHEGVLTVGQIKDFLSGRGVAVCRPGEVDLSMIAFDEKGLVPAIAQDALTDSVLMLAYMNADSIRQTLETGLATYFSRSRQQLWTKGETSGHLQRVREIFYDCDGDTLLLKVEQTGAACHTGNRTCFFRALKTLPGGRSSFAGPQAIAADYAVILDRKQNPRQGSYTNMLLEKGPDKIGKKLVEEAAEVLIAAKNHSREEIAFEAADLMYHLLVLLADAGMSMDDVYAEMQSRSR